MKISVVIPAYNEELYLSSCLESLSRQSENIHEIIVVDNNSTDRTTKIAEQYADKIILEERKGVAFARDRGWREATGDIIASTDADTIVDPSWARTIQNNLDGHVGIFGPVHLKDGKNMENYMAKYGYTAFLKINHAFGFPHFSGQNFAVKRKALEAVGGYNLALSSAEDVDLSKRLIKQGRIRFDDNMVVYTSSRRLRVGYYKFLRHHSSNYLSMLLRGNTHRGFEDVR